MARKKNLAQAAALEPTPPETYDITIIVSHPTDQTNLKVNMPGIKRAHILAPNYKAKGVQAAVRQFEHMVYGLPVPLKE